MIEIGFVHQIGEDPRPVEPTKGQEIRGDGGGGEDDETPQKRGQQQFGRAPDDQGQHGDDEPFGPRTGHGLHDPLSASQQQRIDALDVERRGAEEKSETHGVDLAAVTDHHEGVGGFVHGDGDNSEAQEEGNVSGRDTEMQAAVLAEHRQQRQETAESEEDLERDGDRMEEVAPTAVVDAAHESLGARPANIEVRERDRQRPRRRSWLGVGQIAARCELVEEVGRALGGARDGVINERLGQGGLIRVETEYFLGPMVHQEPPDTTTPGRLFMDLDPRTQAHGCPAIEWPEGR